MELQLILLTSVVGIFVAIGLFIGKIFKNESKNESSSMSMQQSEVSDNSTKKSNTQKANNAAAPKKEGKRKPQKDQHKDTFSHPWLLTTLKGHTGAVTDCDLSENGKYVCSVDEDRGILIWPSKEFTSKDKRLSRGGVSFDHGLKVKWSPDNKAVVVWKASDNVAEVYKVHRKEESSAFFTLEIALTFDKGHNPTEDVIALGFASTGKYIMSCTNKTTLVLWSLRGDTLASVDNYHMNTYCAKVSPCGRFVATSGFTPDVKVFEVKFKGGNFEKVSRAFELTGHTSGVYHFDISGDSTRIATLSKDGSWKLFAVDVDFSRGQDPQCLTTADWKGALDVVDERSMIALSPDAKTVVISHMTSGGVKLTWFDAETGGVLDSVEDAFTTSLVSLAFDKDNRWLIAAGDRYVRVFHNVPGYRLAAKDLRAKAKASNSDSMKRRLEEQAEEKENFLKGLGIH